MKNKTTKIKDSTCAAIEKNEIRNNLCSISCWMRKQPPTFWFFLELKSNKLFHSEEVADKYCVQVTIGLKVINFNFEI